MQTLQRGESEAITLAREFDAELLIDERAGRAIADSLGLRYVGIIGTLIRAKQRGLIPQVIPLIAQARDNAGFHVSDRLFKRARELTGE